MPDLNQGFLSAYEERSKPKYLLHVPKHLTGCVGNSEVSKS
jgi:hypothetical protein